jgi:hypothetical protein
VGKANLLCDALRGRVVRMNDRAEALRAEYIAGVVTAGGSCFCGIAVALEISADVVTDLDVGGSVDFLGCQTAVTDEASSRSLGRG